MVLKTFQAILSLARVMAPLVTLSDASQILSRLAREKNVPIWLSTPALLFPATRCRRNTKIFENVSLRNRVKWVLSVFWSDGICFGISSRILSK